MVLFTNREICNLLLHIVTAWLINTFEPCGEPQSECAHPQPQMLPKGVIAVWKIWQYQIVQFPCTQVPYSSSCIQRYIILYLRAIRFVRKSSKSSICVISVREKISSKFILFLHSPQWPLQMPTDRKESHFVFPSRIIYHPFRTGDEI